MSSPSNSPAKAAPAPQSTPAPEPTPAPESTPAPETTPAPEPTPEPPPEPSQVPAPSPVATDKTHLVYPEVNPNPLLHSNFCSLLFLRWINPFFLFGHKWRLKENEIHSVHPEDCSQHLGEELQGYWKEEAERAEKSGRKPSLAKAIIKCYWKSCLLSAIFVFFEECTRVVLPLLLGKMIIYFEDPNVPGALYDAYVCAAVLSACVFLWAILHHLYFNHFQCAGMRLRVATSHMIYCKALRLSNSAMRKTTTGQIVNLLSNDVKRFDQTFIKAAAGPSASFPRN